MFRKRVSEIRDRVEAVRGAAAQMAESIGAPRKVVNMLKPNEEPEAAKAASSEEERWQKAQNVKSASPAGGERPAAEAAGSAGDLGERVQKLLDEMVNPAIASHGGYINLIEVKDNRAFVTMGGGCQGCAASMLTLKAGVERMIREEIPEIEEVVDTTDHGLGENPYYAG